MSLVTSNTKAMGMLCTVGGILMVLLASAVAAGFEMRGGEEISITGTYDDMVMAGGRRIQLNLQTPDDVLAAGENISINETKADHLVMVGDVLTFSGIEVKDVFAAGRVLTFVDGMTADDLFVAGQDVRLQSGFDVAGSAMLAGRDVSVFAPVGGELRTAGELVHINSVIRGNVRVEASKFVLGPNARISGDLTYRADEIDRSPEAEVTGRTIELEPREGRDFDRWMWEVALTAVIFGLLFMIGFLVLVIVAVLVLPGLMNKSARMISDAPWKSLGIGFLIMVAVPVVIGLLFVTVLGIPLALLIGTVYMATAPVAIAAAIYCIGLLARRLMRRGAADEPIGAGGRLGWTLLAAVLMLIVGLIPLLGALVWLVAYVFGLGAVMTQGGKALAQD